MESALLEQQRPSRTSTRVVEGLEDRVAKILSATDWQPCKGCGQEYLPHVLENGLCDQCRHEDQKVVSQLSDVFRNRAGYLRLAEKEFVATDDNREAYESAKRFNCAVENLYLWGNCGTGKTHLACKIVRAALSRQTSCAFIKTSEWLRSLRGRTGSEEQEEINRLVWFPVLVIDELGFEKATEFAIQSLYDLIDARMMEERNGLVITSNLSLDDLASKFGDDRLPSRLSGICRVIKISGQDWRNAAIEQTHQDMALEARA